MGRPSVLILAFCLTFPFGNANAKCSGEFPNPVTDVCWRCIFPLSIGGAEIADFGMEDTGDHAPAVCACPIPIPPFIRVGIGISFWEPARVAEATTTPFCSPVLGGTELGSLSWVKRGTQQRDHQGNNAFYHVHWLLFPLTNWFSLITDGACATPESMDVLMFSELEPTWGDDELSMILSPEAVLFATPALQASCAADCVAASTGFPLDPLFWCAGCQGGIYPMSGNITGSESGLDGGLLAIMRMHAKMHRTFLAVDYGSRESMCMPVPIPIMAKSRYKTQMLYPAPTTSNAHSYGRFTGLWAAGRQYPIKGEDFAYLIWRKRVCCAL